MEITNRSLNRFFTQNVQVDREESEFVEGKVHAVVKFLVKEVQRRDRRFRGEEECVLYVGSAYQKTEVKGHSDFDFNLLIPQLQGWCRGTETGGCNGEVEVTNYSDDVIEAAHWKSRFEPMLTRAMDKWNDRNSTKVRLATFQNGIATRLKIFCPDCMEREVKVDMVLALNADNFQGNILENAKETIVKEHHWIPDWLLQKMRQHLVLTPKGGGSPYWDISLAYGQMVLARHLDSRGKSTCKKKLFRILKAMSKEFWGDCNMKSGITSHIILNALCWAIEENPDNYHWANRFLADRFRDLVYKIHEAVEDMRLEFYFTQLHVNLMTKQEEKTGFPWNLESKILSNDLYDVEDESD